MKTAYQQNIAALLDVYAEPPEELVPLSPLAGPLSPVARPKYHGDQCFCEDCADLRASQQIYHEQKAIFERNGFI